MARPRITVNKTTVRDPEGGGPDHVVIDFDELKRRIRTREIVRDIWRYRDASLRTYQLSTLPKPFVSASLVRLLTTGDAWLEDETGSRQLIDAATMGRFAARFARAALTRRRLIDRVSAQVTALERMLGVPRRAALDLPGHSVYLRTDLWFGVAAGGSVGHIAGVLNNLGAFTDAPIFLTTDPIATVRADVETHVLLPEAAFWDFNELPALAYNATFLESAESAVRARRLAFLYQRYSTNNFGGVELARRAGVPFVLEYNGSEVWINRNWGTPLRYEALAERIELLNLRAADLVVVVSAVMRDELLGRGVDPARILVNPNGVDTDVYAPAVDGSAVRAAHGLADRCVIGFIGTFGPWHGAEVLADAVATLLARRPELRDRVRVLMIGDGARMTATRAVAEQGGIGAQTVFTGRVPQAQGPAYLAACDILVAPHVPNADGTPFFGSPTKLFEYMAMGRAIVASALDQIGEVLSDGRTALLTTPGDPTSLARALERAIDDPALRGRLGAAARADAVAHHTWRDHTGRIVEALAERCG